MKVKDYIWLIVIILIVLAFNIVFLLRTNYFTGDSAYFNIRNTEYVLKNKVPMYYDELSYSGREVIVTPLFYYILAFFRIFFSEFFVYKFIPLLSIVFLLLVIYLIAKEITHDKRAIFLSVLFAGFVPILSEGVLNQVSVNSFLLPLMFFMIYCLMKMRIKNIYLIIFVILSFILPLLHQDSVLFVFSLLIYLVIVNVESLMYLKLKREAILFFTLLWFLIEFFIFKNAFLEYGINIIWQNVPKQILGSYFRDVSLFEIIYKVGVLPVFFGTIGIFFGSTREKRENILFLISLILISSVFLWLNLISAVTGLMILGISLSIMSSLGLQKSFDYLVNTKFHKTEKNISLFLIVIVVLFMVIPSIFVANKVINSAPNEDEVEVLKWLNDTTFDFSVIAGTLEEGNLIAYYSGRKNVMDTNFLLAPSTDERFEDLNMLFTTKFETNVKEISDKYSIDRIFFSNKAREKYKMDSLYYEGKECLKKLKELRGVKVYEVRC